MLPAKVIIKGLVLPAAIYYTAQFAVASGLFDLYPWLDIPFHFFGGASIAIMGAIFLHALQAGKNLPRLPGWFLVLFLTALTALLAIAWELYEVILDRYFDTLTQLGLYDALGDLLVGTSGGLAGAVIWLWTRLKKFLF